jgi:hypothetical protein
VEAMATGHGPRLRCPSRGDRHAVSNSGLQHIRHIATPHGPPSACPFTLTRSRKQGRFTPRLVVNVVGSCSISVGVVRTPAP